MRDFQVSYEGQPWRNRKFKVRGVCKFDVLNPCFDNRPTDVSGKHWAGGAACQACTEEAKKFKCK